MFKGDTDLVASINNFKSWVASADAMAEKYATPPPPIDFEATKKVARDKAIVDALENFYKASKPPPKTYEWSAEDKAFSQQQIDEAKSREAFTVGTD